MSAGPPPPPPPPPQIRPGGGGPPPPPPGARPPPGFQPIRQQSTRVQDITPPKLMDEKACLKELTTYATYTLRKCAPVNPKAKPTWARAELTEERIPQKEIEREIKKLNERRETISEKRAALQPNQHTQITTLLDNLATQEQDKAFDWSLVQMDSEKRKSKKGKREAGKSETVTMTVYVKRAPREDLNPVMLYQNIERMKAERMRPQPPPPPPPQQQGPPPPKPGPPPQQMDPRFQHHNIDMSKDRSRQGSRKPSGRGKRDDKKYHSQHDDSTVTSYDSDTASTSSSESDSATSASEGSRGQRHHSKGPSRSHSKPSPKLYHPNLPIRSPRSPDRHSNEADAYGGIPSQRPHAPEVPRPIPGLDPIISAYQAGKEDALAERYGNVERNPLQSSVQPVVIERIGVPRPQNVISYARPIPERKYSEQIRHRYSGSREPRYIDERYIDDLRRQNEYDDRLRDAEEYIERVPVGRVPLARVPLDSAPLEDRVPIDHVPLDRGVYRREPRVVGYEHRSSDPVLEYERRPSEPRRDYERRLFDDRGEYDIPGEFVPPRPSPPGRIFNNLHPFSPSQPPPLRRVYPSSSTFDTASF